MDVETIKRGLTGFIRSHRTQFDDLAKSESALLEIGALALATQHYEREHYKVVARNLRGGEFRVKTTSSGRPENFSWFEVFRGSTHLELHANLPVRSAYGLDQGVYVVDVAVVRGGAVPLPSPKTWRAVDSDTLITFIEAKKLVIFPMLLAQFIGIVHELRPNFLVAPRRPYGFVAQGNFDPALVSIGYLHGISAGIERSFSDRNTRVRVVPSMDSWLARLRGSPEGDSPLRRDSRKAPSF